MLHVTIGCLKDILGKDTIKGNKQLEERFEQVLYLFKGQYPPSKLGNDSVTMAFAAFEFVLNAESYFAIISPNGGKAFFDNHKDRFLKHFGYKAIIDKIAVGDRMLFLYDPSSTGQKKISAHGVIGKFHAIETFNYQDNPYRNYIDEPESNMVVIRLELGNKGIIDLPVIKMAYFGTWDRKLELIM